MNSAYQVVFPIGKSCNMYALRRQELCTEIVAWIYRYLVQIAYIRQQNNDFCSRRACGALIKVITGEISSLGCGLGASAWSPWLQWIKIV